MKRRQASERAPPGRRWASRAGIHSSGQAKHRCSKQEPGLKDEVVAPLRSIRNWPISFPLCSARRIAGQRMHKQRNTRRASRKTGNRSMPTSRRRSRLTPNAPGQERRPISCRAEVSQGVLWAQVRNQLEPADACADQKSVTLGRERVEDSHRQGALAGEEGHTSSRLRFRRRWLDAAFCYRPRGYDPRSRS